MFSALLNREEVVCSATFAAYTEIMLPLSTFELEKGFVFEKAFGVCSTPTFLKGHLKVPACVASFEKLRGLAVLLTIYSHVGANQLHLFQ